MFQVAYMLIIISFLCQFCYRKELSLMRCLRKNVFNQKFLFDPECPALAWSSKFYRYFWQFWRFYKARRDLIQHIHQTIVIFFLCNLHDVKTNIKISSWYFSLNLKKSFFLKFFFIIFFSFFFGDSGIDIKRVFLMLVYIM